MALIKVIQRFQSIVYTTVEVYLMHCEGKIAYWLNFLPLSIIPEAMQYCNLILCVNTVFLIMVN